MARPARPLTRKRAATRQAAKLAAQRELTLSRRQEVWREKVWRENVARAEPTIGIPKAHSARKAR